jgi:outer membrane protein assembly factor BamB
VVVLAGVVLAGLVPWTGWHGTPAASALPAEPAQPVDESTAYQMTPTHDGVIEGTTQRPPLAQKWVRDLGGTVSYPLVTNGRVFVVARDAGYDYGTTLYALDADTGEDVWGPIDLAGTYYWSGITSGDGRVYAMTYDGVLRAFDEATGELDWIVDLPYQYSFSSEPTYRDGVVYSGGAGSGGTVYATRASDGHLLWTASVANGDHSSPAVTEDGVYVSYACLRAYRFDRSSGDLDWLHATGCSGGGGRTPVVANGRVWIRDHGSPLVLDAETGALVNAFASVRAPAVTSTRAYMIDGGTLKAKNADSLLPLWSFTGDTPLTSAPIVVNGYVYVGSTSGRLYALDEVTGTPVWSTDVGAPILPPDEHNVSEPVTGLGAGNGLIVVPASNLLAAYAHVQSKLVPLSPTRLFDTRPEGPQLGYAGATPMPGDVVDIDVLGEAGVPASGVAAVVMTVTATQSASPGHVTVWPSGAPMPLASSLNIGATNQTVANQVIVPVGEDGRVSMRTTGGGHLLADVTGYFAPVEHAADGRFAAVAPQRVLDTRPTGPQVGYVGTKPGGGDTVSLTVLGQNGVPESGVSAVALNLTATEPEAAGYVTVWPSGQTRPLASSLNMDHAKQNVAAAVTVPVGEDGKIQLYSPTTTHLVVDVAGYYTDATSPDDTTGLFVPTIPTRLVDTRPAGPQVGYTGNKPAAGATVAAALAGQGPVPTEGVHAVAFNLTSTENEAVGYATAWPHGSPRPLASNLNYDTIGQSVPNMALVGLGDGGAVDLYTLRRSHLILDLAGYFRS